MKPFEDEVRSALRRREPPEGFARRVMSRIEDERHAQGRPLSMFFRAQPFRWLAAGALGLILIIGLASYRQRVQAQKDSEQAVLALRIAGRTLNVALDRAARAGQRLQDGRE